MLLGCGFGRNKKVAGKHWLSGKGGGVGYMGWCEVHDESSSCYVGR